MSQRPNTNNKKAGPPTARTLFPGSGASLGGTGASSTRRPTISNSTTGSGSGSSARGSGPNANGSWAGPNLYARIFFYMSLYFTYVSFRSTRSAIENGSNSNNSNGSLKQQQSSSNTNKLALAMLKTPIGSLGSGQSSTSSNSKRHYDSLFYTTMQYGADATSVIEVGCSSNTPFLVYLDWIDRKTCVGPLFDENGMDMRNTTTTALIEKNDEEAKVEKTDTNFMNYLPPKGSKKFDLLLCNQGLEQVADPGAYVKKLISTATTSIISVPYECDTCNHHVTDHITYDMIMEWSAPHVPVYSGIVAEIHESAGEKMERRIILVYKPDEEAISNSA